MIKTKKSLNRKEKIISQYLLLNNQVKYAYNMYFYQSVELSLHFLVFTCVNLESIHFCREHSNRNSISSSNKLIFRTAATSFFSEMGFCLTFFGFWKIPHCLPWWELELLLKVLAYSVTVATKFLCVIYHATLELTTSSHIH